MSIHTFSSRQNYSLTRTAFAPCVLVALVLFTTSPCYAQGTGIREGGCVLPGGGLPTGIPGAPDYFASLRKAAKANARSSQLQSAFHQLSNEMDQSLSSGNLVSAFRQYLVFAENAEKHQRDVSGIEQEFIEVRNRATVVLNFAVTTATRTLERTPTDEPAMMTLMEIANMPQLRAPADQALRILESMKDQESYQSTLKNFQEKYQIRNLAPISEEQTSDSAQKGKRSRR